MKILIAGSHGMVGSAVTQYLIERGHEVVRLVREEPRDGELWWDPETGAMDSDALDGFDGVVHLATMRWPMRWTSKSKQAMRANRLATNRLLAESLAMCERKPRVLVCASGMGYYPSSGDELITEETPPGTSFLSKLQQDGEAATAPASQAGIRVVHLRIPAVMGGDALKLIGFQPGDGQQWSSWVGRDELASIIEFVLTTESLSGPVNASSPNPMRSADFAHATSQALGQKYGGAMPAMMVRLVMGEMGEELLLASRRMQPAKLLAAGYRFRFPEVDEALRHEKELVEADLVAQPTV